MLEKTAVDNMIQVRNSLEGKKFESLDQFLELVDSQKVNKKTMDSLAKAGAFDQMGYKREEIVVNFDKLIERAEKKKQDSITGQSNLFSFANEEEPVYLSKSRKWSNLEKLNFEKNVIGFYLSEHPLDYFKCYTRFFPSQKIQDIKNNQSEVVKVWGILDQLKETVTRKGSVMAFAQLEDETGYLNLIFFSKVYLDLEKLLKKNEPMYVEGRIGKDESRCIVEKVIPLSLFLSNRTKIEITLSKSIKDHSLNALKEIMEKNQGNTSVIFKLDCDKVSLNLLSRHPSGVSLNLPMLENVRKLVSSRNIRLM